MSLLDKSKKNTIIEKKIILKKKNKSLSQKSFFENKATPTKYTFPSKFQNENSIPFDNCYEVNHAKRLDYNINPNYALNQIQTISEQEIYENNYKNENLINLKKYYFPKKYEFHQKNNEQYFNKIDNIYNNSIQTPIKNNNFKYNIKSNTQSKSSELYANYGKNFEIKGRRTTVWRI